jgi:hypothetical protein
MSDGLNMQPRIGEPESALVPGMAAHAVLKATERLSVPALLTMPDTSYPGSVAAPSPATWVYDFDPATGSSRATFNGEVAFTSGGSSTAGVTTFNTRSGAVVLTAADVTGVGGIANPNAVLTGTPTAPTPPPGDSTAKVATTAFVAAAIVANPIVQSFNGRTGAVALTTGDITSAGGAPAASPTLTGNPQAPTPLTGDHSSSIATTQFVANTIASGTVASFNGRQGPVSLTLSDVLSVGGAPVASPNFTGTPSGPTAAPGTATTQLASTAFVTNAVVAASSGVASFNTRTGAVTLQAADISSAGGALLLSPAFTGTPTAPTPAVADNTTKIATTAFVANAITAAPNVTSFNGRQGVVALTLADVTSVGGAPVASPAFTGSPLTTTPAPGDNSTRIADTAFVAAGFTTPAQVTAQLGAYLPLAGGVMTGALTPTQVAGIVGTTAANNAAAGSVGEFVTAQQTGNIAMTSGTPINLTSINLTAGDWDVWGLFASGFSVGGFVAEAALSLVAGTLPPSAGTFGFFYPLLSLTVANISAYSLPIPISRLSIAAPTTVYLVAQTAFGSGTSSGNGYIAARRVR